MGVKEDVLALAEELDGVSLKDDCESCLASGTGLCRGDLECAESAHKACAKRLREIVEHDAGEVTTVSAYDLLPDEDRKAIEWVREHGGIAEVKDEWKRRNNLKRRLEKAQDKVGRQQRHIEELQRKLAERRDGINAMRSRLMPDGMEWPRFEDSEPVRFGDEFVDCNGDTGVVYTVKFGKHAFRVRSIEGNVIAFEHGDRVKRPAPKMVDADGVEIKPGDTAYYVDGRDQRVNTVAHITADGLVQFGRINEAGHVTYCEAACIHPEQLTHEQPDDWSRWREDLELSPVEYADRYRIGRFGHEELDTYRDLVRRAKKLAEKE